MPIRVTCPGCRISFHVRDHLAGRQGLCPECGEVVSVAEPDIPRLEPVVPAYTAEAADRADRPRRSRRRPPPSPRDHLPQWRRVATGFLVQQAGATLNLVAVALFVAAITFLADEQAGPDAEPDTVQLVVVGGSICAALLGVGLLALGRFVSAGTPVRAPRMPGWASALLTAGQVPLGCVFGLFVGLAGMEQQAADPDPALVMLVGLSIIGGIFLLATGECFHAFAMGSIGRVLRADGLCLFGRGLGLFVIFGGFLMFVALAIFGVMDEGQDPDVPNPDADLFAMLLFVGMSLLIGLYLVLDVALLQAGRTTIARLADDDLDRPVSEDDAP